MGSRLAPDTGRLVSRLSQASSVTIAITQTYISENVHTASRLVSPCPASTLLPFSPCDHLPSRCTPVHPSVHLAYSGAIGIPKQRPHRTDGVFGQHSRKSRKKKRKSRIPMETISLIRQIAKENYL